MENFRKVLIIIIKSLFIKFLFKKISYIILFTFKIYIPIYNNFTLIHMIYIGSIALTENLFILLFIIFFSFYFIFLMLKYNK